MEKAKGRTAKIISIFYWHVHDSRGKIFPVSLDKVIAFVNSKKNLYLVGAVNMDKAISEQLKKLERLVITGSGLVF